jgi:predicted adenine nucleotide alpha hydrolase (AANH) superfamily ATPase
MNIVLHVCCGVCAAGVANVLLAENYRVTGYFYNPNIYPQEEYQRRLEAAGEAARRCGYSLIEGPYEPALWNASVEGLEDEPEGGKRCLACYRHRLEKTHSIMKEQGAQFFTSTLSISPHKSVADLNRIGAEIGGEAFMARDFKKKDGFKRAMELSRQWELYRQNYCGCQYSLKAARGY